MRWLMWFTLGFAAACGVGAYLFRGVGLIVLAAISLMLAIPAVRLGRKWKYLAAGTVVLLGMAAGSGLCYGYDALYVTPARAMDDQVVELRLTATDYSLKTEYGCTVDGNIELDGKRYKLRLYLDEYVVIRPGDLVVVPAKLRFTDEGGQKEPSYHRTNGILLLGYQEDGVRFLRNAADVMDFPGKLRQKLLRLMEECFPEDTVGFAKALLLGDKTGLRYETSLSFRLTGLSHLVAVSGLHVSILFALVYHLAGKRRYLAGLIGIPVVLLFAAVAGFTPSVTRAAIMQVIMMLALMIRREYDPPTALSFAVLMMLIVNPLVIASAGFQMSVSSVAGIHLLYGNLKKRIRAGLKLPKGKIANAAASSLALSTSASLLTVPLMAYYYGTVSLVSLIANLIVVPVISVIFYGIMLVCLAGAVQPAVGALFGRAVSLFVRYVFEATEFLSELPLAAVYTQSVYIVFWLILCYGLFTGLLLMKAERIWPAVCCGVLGLCLSLTVSFAEPLLDDYRVTVLDVGQGQCVILQSRGSTFLVDCGGDYDQDAGDKAAERLLSMGISRIDGLILTHYDRDHVGGVTYLAQRIGIDRVYLPQTADTDGLLSGLLTATEDSEQIWLDSDMEISFGACVIRIFAPEKEKTGNESCAAVLFRSEKYDTLITGDMNAARERQLLATGELTDLEVLIVGHHGSKTSTSAELVYGTAPDLAIISVGADNAYGHPADEILSRLALYGCEVYRTDLMGDIIFRG